MKIIDLLNKIANGEYPIIKEGINKYRYSHLENDYITGMGYDYEHFFSSMSNILDYLNDEIQIIEEPKKIEKIKLDSEECIEYYEDDIKKHFNTNKKDKMYVKILNEIIDYINSKEDK